MGWLELILAFALFFLSHSVPVRPPMRPWLVKRLGPLGFTLAYSMLSLAILCWLIVAAGRAPVAILWYWAPWQSWAALMVMLLACLTLAFSIARPNPFSFGGSNNDRFDPARPGIVRITRHPLLAVLALWAMAHLLANGDLAHAILFGTFAAFAILGGRLVDRRKKQEMGPAWNDLLSRVNGGPLRSALRIGPGCFIDVAIRLACAFGLYLGLLTLHPVVIGVTPIP